jgi:hypothetical protein
MTDNIFLRRKASPQTNRLETTTPQPLHSDPQAPADDLPEDKVPRKERREGWHAKKIQDRRSKKKHRPATMGPNSLEAPSSLDSEPCSTLLATQMCHAVSGRVCALHNRTESQQKTIRELKLCAGCLTRTTPPHKPADKQAPCKGQPSAPFSEANISKIRKGLHRQAEDIRRRDFRSRIASGPVPRDQQRQPAYAPSTSSQHKADRASELALQHNDKGNGTPTLASSYAAHARPGDHNTYAPLYIRYNSSSYIQKSLGNTPDTSYTQNSETQSQPCVTWADGRVASFPGAQTFAVHRLENFGPQGTTTAKRRVSLSIDVLGMDTPTPIPTGIPEIHIEGDDELRGVRSHFTGMVPDWGSSISISSLQSDERDWDVETNVTDRLQRLELEGVDDEKPTSSELEIEKLLHKEKQTVLSANRSWTLKGLCPSLVSFSLATNMLIDVDVPQSSHGWDDATMVDEPQELPSEYVPVSPKALERARSFESFIPVRQGIFWL